MWFRFCLIEIKTKFTEIKVESKVMDLRCSIFSPGFHTDQDIFRTLVAVILCCFVVITDNICYILVTCAMCLSYLDHYLVLSTVGDWREGFLLSCQINYNHGEMQE